MAEQTEDKGGMGVGSAVGGIAGGAGVGYFADKHIAKRGIANVINSSVKATENFTDSVNTIFTDAKNGALREQHNLHAALRAETGATVKKVRFVTDKLNNDFAMYLGDGERRGYFIKGIKELPEGFTIGKTVTDEAKIGALFNGEKSMAAQVEKSAVAGIKKAGPALMGLRNAGWGGKGVIVGAAVAGTAAGALVVHKLFGGKHANAVNQPDAPQVAAAR